MTNNRGITQLPDADRILGLHIEPAGSPRLTVVSLQYTNARTGDCEVRIPLLDALHLLNLLEAMSANHGYDALRRPPTT